MAGIVVRRFSSADETHPFSHGEMDILRFGDVSVARTVLAPGWQWSRDNRDVNAESCQEPHALYVLSGKMHFAMDDGEECELSEGDYALIPPGHDAWTVGDQECIVFDVPSIEKEAQRAARAQDDGMFAVPS
jgi:mannose-6-phosphate isomerase-like protein (cupin superfamily)